MSQSTRGLRACWVSERNTCRQRIHAIDTAGLDVYYSCTMPELPEVETVVRGLAVSLVGRTIVKVEVGWARSVVGLRPEEFAGALVGRKVCGVERRGKWIVILFDNREALLVHLRMSGQLIWDSYISPDDPHIRARFVLDEGAELCFVDTRKFGRLWLVEDPADALNDLGPEPLADDFTVDRFIQMLSGRKARMKSLLLNQRFLAGLGNIYTDESLWMAGIHPLKQGGSLTKAEARRLHRAIQVVLQAALLNQGASLRDGLYRTSDGDAGAFGRELAVYGRQGSPCPRCAEIIVRIRVGQRSTHYCPRCQPE